MLASSVADVAVTSVTDTPDIPGPFVVKLARNPSGIRPGRAQLLFPALLVARRHTVEVRRIRGEPGHVLDSTGTFVFTFGTTPSHGTELPYASLVPYSNVHSAAPLASGSTIPRNTAES